MPDEQFFDLAVVVPTYNAHAYLPDTLAALGSQTLRPREIIVVDDGSDDGSGELAASWRFPWGEAPRVVQHPRPLGAGAARNHGAFVATSEWVAFCDNDDVWHPRRIEVLADLARRHADAGALATEAVGFALEDDRCALSDAPRADMVSLWVPDSRPATLTAALGDLAPPFCHQDSGDTAADRVVSPAAFCTSSVFTTTVVAVRRHIYFMAGGNLPLFPRCEEYPLHATLAAMTSLTVTPQPLVFYRVRPGSLSDRVTDFSLQALIAMLAVRLHHATPAPEPPTSLFRHLVLADARTRAPWRRTIGLVALGGLSWNDAWTMLKAQFRARLP